ncbi:MAG: PAS domain S-box protein, partial [Verrucomicrobia bacterium]|nr:PAS domain S-box protein [Verrucomicrobiota bacterium]
MNGRRQNKALKEELIPRASRENWWQRLFEQSEDAQLVCYHDGRVLEMNPRASKLFGFNEGGSNTFDFSIFSCLTDATASRLCELLGRNKGQQENVPAVTLLSEGRLCLIADLNVVPLSDGRSLVTVKDASRRWRMESHVQRLMAAVDSTPDVIFMTDSELRITFVNVAFQSVTGYAVEEVLGRRSDFLRLPAEKGKIAEYLDFCSKGKDWQGELMNKRADGTVYPVESTISPIFDIKGNFLGYAAFERDLTTKKGLQDELLKGKNYILSILNSIDSAVYTLDREFRISHANEGWKKLPRFHGWLTLNGEPQPGKSLLDYVEDEVKRYELKSKFIETLSDGITKQFQVTDTDEHHWSVRLAPWFNKGEICGLIYIVTDQTQLFELQRQLYHAQKMETIGELAAGIAHDFNNLLQVILGNAGLIAMNESLDGKLLHQVERIEQAGQRAKGITQQLLTFGRANSEQMSALDFNKVIMEASQLAQRSLMKHIKLVLRPHSEPVRVRMDGTRAYQMILNFCVNAQDAMPGGGELIIENKVVSLSYKQALKAGVKENTNFLCCTISDTGCGIADKDFEKIFNPFFTTKEKGKGTGLGLSIAQSIITQAGGFIDVESELNKGTTFKIFLPLTYVKSGTSDKKITPKLKKGTGSILVVDDIEWVLEFVSSFLRTSGYDVHTANSAEEALKFIKEDGRKYDLLLTDHNM